MDHDSAKALVDSLGLTPAESLFLRAVSSHETNYGDGWKVGRGAGSNNMGAVMRPGSFGRETPLNPLDFKHEDSRFDPKQGKVVKFIAWFKGYPSPIEGFADLSRILLKPNTKAAITTGSLMAGAAAMFDNGYYTGIRKTRDENIADYTSALSRNLAKILAATGEPNLFPLASRQA